MATTDAEHGHHWKEADRVAHFAARMDERAAEREAQFDLLGRLLPYESGDAFHILDVGAGYGAVAESLLRRFPAASATLLDLSDAMIEEGRRRLSSLDGRFNYVQGDFADGSLPHDVAGPYEVIVSSLAIHHLPPDGKRDLYADIASRLTPGGCFFNIDSVGAADAETEAIYTRASAREETTASEESSPPAPASPAPLRAPAPRSASRLAARGRPHPGRLLLASARHRPLRRLSSSGLAIRTSSRSTASIRKDHHDHHDRSAARLPAQRRL